MKCTKLILMLLVLVMIGCDKVNESSDNSIDSIILISANELSSSSEIVLDWD